MKINALTIEILIRTAFFCYKQRRGVLQITKSLLQMTKAFLNYEN